MQTSPSLCAVALLLVGLVPPVLGAAPENRPPQIEVTSLGAVPDDGQDDTAAVLAAFERCKTENACGIAFPRGRYDFHAPAEPEKRGVLFPVRELHDAVVDGRGSELIFHGITGCFFFANCSGVTVRDLVIDWERPPFSVGVITAAAEGSFEVEVHPEFPVQGGEPVRAFMDYEPDTGLPCGQGLDVYALETPLATELVRPQVLRVTLPPHVKTVTPGKWAVLRHEVYGPGAFSANACRDMRFEGITVHTCPGMAFTASGTENVTLDRCAVQPRPGTRRLISATADGSHFSGCTGDLVITNCVFDGQGDDAVNMKSGLFLTVTEMVDGQTVLARHNLGFPCPPAPGDAMELMPQETLLPFGSVPVRSAELLEDRRTHRVVFEEPLPEGVKPGTLLANATRLPKARVKDCVFRRNRARGLLIQVRDAVVEDCVFSDVTSAGVLVISEAVHFYESIPARHVVIRNNVFTHCNYGAAVARGVVSVEGITPGWGDVPAPGVFQDITIEGNAFRGSDNAAVFMTGTDTAVLRNNVIEGVCARPTQPRCASALHIESSRNVAVTGNTAMKASQGPGCAAVLTLGDRNDSATITVSGNTGF